MYPQYKVHCEGIEVRKTEWYQLGAIKTWVYVPHSHSEWSSVSIEDEEWTLLMQIIKEKHNDMVHGLYNDSVK